MRKINRGKDFEAAIRESLETVKDASVDRLPDQMSGFKGSKNICDYVVFHSPDIFYIECKSKYENTLNFKGDISQDQWDGLLKKSKIKRCVAGVCVWFIDHDLTVFVNINDLEKHRQNGAKSLNIKDITGENSIPHFIVDGMKKRVKFKYFGDKFIYNLHKLSDSIWGDNSDK